MISKEQFEKKHAKCAGVSLKQMKKYLKAIRCNCGAGFCVGWQMIPTSRALKEKQVVK